MELPWMSVASARAELESDSSSLLRSIYGSQVSQVLLVSDDSNTSLFNEGTWAQERTGRRFVRPKSSPALTRSEKENQQSSLKSQTNLAPYSAPRTTRALQRPATARVSERGGAGRPISAVSCIILGGTGLHDQVRMFIAALSSTVGGCGEGSRRTSQS